MNELITREHHSMMPVMNITDAIERRNQVVSFVKQIMVEETDYGTIPGTNKPTLLKPGAEKLATFFGLSKRFDIIERTEDWTGNQHNGEPFFYYLYRCSLYRGDLLIAEADGSCSSFESKYRYRRAERVCPNCGQATIIKGKDQYGGGWVCWKKKDGCGATFAEDDEVITGQEVGRVVNPDVPDQANTILKMAQKRALIAAVLLGVNASEFFTQDLEDYPIDIIDVEPQPVEQPKAEPKPAPKSKPVKVQKANGNASQWTAFWTAVRKYDISKSDAQQILDKYDNDPAKALDAIDGFNQQTKAA